MGDHVSHQVSDGRLLPWLRHEQGLAVGTASGPGRGVETLPGGCTVDCWNDHRIAMMTAVAATRCERPVALLGAECVAKSYPNFWEHYQMLGGEVREHSGK